MQHTLRTNQTLVVDDQLNEARPLLEALTKLHIPFVYTQGKPASEYPLPKEDNYSLLFLDLNIDFKFSGSLEDENNTKLFQSTHANLLNRVLRNKAKSFILIIWSNEEENYSEVYKKIFSSEGYYKTEKCPFDILSLKKSDFFETHADGNYTFKVGKDNELKNKISELLNSLKSFKLLNEWGNIISDSGKDTIDNIMDLLKIKSDDQKMDDYLAIIFTQVSIAYLGEKQYLKSDQKQRTKALFLALSKILEDKMSFNIYSSIYEYLDWDNIPATTAERTERRNRYRKEIAVLNEKLIFNPSFKDKEISGAIYKRKIDPNGAIHRSIDSDKTKKNFKKSKIYKDIESTKKGKGKEDLEKIEKLLEKKCNEYINNIKSEAIPINLNISPACDIAQGKIIVHRLIPGFICTLDFELISSEYLYKSPIFMYNGIESIIVLDYRYAFSLHPNEIYKKQVLLIMRSEFVKDIQTKLSSHVSRLGTFNL